ncbi:MAG: type II toxin-antitoxin system ParD family antitoxin [Nitrospinae bacterium]|nr:type II toxin-antitoxin system ParD family antitoxin [Nitrospinota bacterium]
MHISLTPELEKIVKSKVQTGLYNNASEVIREALRFMETHEELIYQMKLEKLRTKLAVGAEQANRGEFVDQSISKIIEEAKQEHNA